MKKRGDRRGQRRRKGRESDRRDPKCSIDLKIALGLIGENAGE